DVHGYYWARYDGGATHRAKNGALKNCQKNSPKPETCKIMDVDGKSDYIKQRGLASAPAAVTSPAEVTANSQTEPYLEWLNLHRRLERALARTPDGRLFGDTGYAQTDAKNNAKRGCKRYFGANCEIVDINGRNATDLAIPLPGSVAGIWCELPSYDNNLRVYEDTVGIAFLEQASCEKLSGTALSGLIRPASDSPQEKVQSAGDNYSSEKKLVSVVIILHPGGGLGAGFYVSEDTILTNYHVISGSTFLEIGLTDGSETFGKVFAKDTRLDLALVKVQQRGAPVSFYSKNVLAVGSTVEAIGHPAGLEYSITRGTVSGIRRLPSSYDPGGKAVRLIQADVAIKPGNSGGPLYLDDEVIGVNTQKLVSEEIEGLSFAVHYSEVIRFLEKNGIK
ncbi:MAG: trypsin-like peptidase domain-containing protein, partial [Arenicellales bacterium]|nr:trypsin-like peptidase domain-containing protein [Arenicellales bacterium]